MALPDRNDCQANQQSDSLPIIQIKNSLIFVQCVKEPLFSSSENRGSLTHWEGGFLGNQKSSFFLYLGSVCSIRFCSNSARRIIPRVRQ